MAISDIDPARDATVLLIGRGGAYPALSVALGERMGVVGALSIEAAAKHLNTRDIDGIVLGEGFTPRVVDAFLTVLTEDARFRNLPVIVTAAFAQAYELANLEIVAGDPAHVAASILPMLRQHAFEVHLSRTLRSIDAAGLIDARTGLLTSAAFERDFATAVYQSQSRGSGLSAARFAFDPAHPRAQFDGARIISRLMRQSDFGAVEERLRHRGVCRNRSAQRPHDRAAPVGRDAPHQPRQARHPRRTGRDGRNADAERFRESLLARLPDEAQRAALKRQRWLRCSVASA